MPNTYYIEEIEDIILGMAEVVYENRELRRKLREAEEYKEKYQDLLNQSVKTARDNSAALFNAIINGAFATPEERAARNQTAGREG